MFKIKPIDIAMAAIGAAAVFTVAATPVPASACVVRCGVWLNGTETNGITLQGTSLNGLGFNGVSLQGTRVSGIDAQCADASGKACKPGKVHAGGPGLVLQGISLQGIRFNGVSLNSAKLNDIKWNGVFANSRNLNGPVLQGSRKGEALAPKITIRSVTLANGQRVAIK